MKRNNFSFQKPRASKEEIEALIGSNSSLRNLFPRDNILSLCCVKDTAGYTYSSRYNKDDAKQQLSKEKNNRKVLTSILISPSSFFFFFPLW